MAKARQTNIWMNKPLDLDKIKVKESSLSATKKDVSLSQREIDLAYRLAEEQKCQAFEEQWEWNDHYHKELKAMYHIFLNGLKQAHIPQPQHILSFYEFRRYVYFNTERYFDLKRRKKIRPLS